MPCTITNLTRRRLNIPYVDDILEPGEKKTYEWVERDVMCNDYRVVELENEGKIYIDPEPGGTFSSVWNATDPFRMEPYQMWIDSNESLRIINGTPTSDMDGIEVGAGAVALEPVLSQIVHLTGRNFAQVRAAFFSWWNDPTMASWDSYWNYCLWTFAATTGTHPLTWSTPQRFASTSDLFDFMESYLPSSGGAYTENVAFKIYDEVDVEDAYPSTLVHRNSLVASMAGRNRWTRKAFNGGYYGVSPHFNAPSYYTNFYGELGQRLVQAATSTLPPTNNDDCIWYPRASRGLWHWPSGGIEVPGVGNRGAVWDDTANTWVSPAPVGWYAQQAPYMLHEYKRNRVLSLYRWSGPEIRHYEMNSVGARIFPVVMSGRYYAFVVYPHGGDSWATEYHDTSIYDVTLKLRYSGTFNHRYVGISPWPTVGGNNERLMWSCFAPDGSGSYLAMKQPGQFVSDIDGTAIPLKVYMSRRNKTTGRRSRWVPLYQVKRRLRNASLRVEPAV